MSEIQQNKTPKKQRRRKWILASFIFIFLVGLLGWWWLEKWSRKHGFEGASDFTRTVVSNYWSSFNAKYETAEITLDANDFEKLEAQREAHLRKGIITKVTDRYVPAIISYNGKKIKCRIRLKGHMTDHLQDKKWSFRIKTSGGDAFKGMRIFTVQHPGTRNYIYEWIYHQLLNQEGIATVRYFYINLKVNGESWGIYAVEENFGEELIAHHRLPDGPILGFNPDMYWYSRLNQHEKIPVNYDNFRFNATYPEAYDEKANFSSAEKRSDYSEAVSKLYLFTSGKLKTSEVFDIDKLARFHAIIDLVGGHFSLDWSDVKYYYNPQTRKIEPVGYESFSVRNTSYLCGANKFRSHYEGLPELHELLFNDVEFLKQYFKHLRRIAAKSYLDKFFDNHNSELENSLNILYAEFPYKKLPLDQYYKNQRNITTLLNEPITHVCYLEKSKGDSIQITLGNTGSYPLEISGIRYKDSVIELDTHLFTSSRRKNEMVAYEKWNLHFIKPNEFDNTKLSLVVSSMGKTGKNYVAIKPIEFSDQLDKMSTTNENPNIAEFDFLIIDNENKIIQIQEGEHVIDHDLIIPKEYHVIGSSPLKLDLIKGASVFSGSPIRLTGTSESPVELYSSDSTGGGIILTDVEGISNFSYVYFMDLARKNKKNETFDAVINIYESQAQFRNCVFSSSSGKAIQAIRGIVGLSNCDFSRFEEGIKLIFSNTAIQDCNFGYISKSVIKSKGSFGTMRKISIIESGVGLEMNDATFMNLTAISMRGVKTGVSSTDFSVIKISDISLEKVETGFLAEKKSEIFGPGKIVVTGLKKSAVKTLTSNDKNSKIVIK